jgi:acyl-CoA synthetase (AMP-forming)/AMP-acid ligase II
MTLPDLRAQEATVTGLLLAAARMHDGHRALAGGVAGAAYSYGELAVTVQRAAAGLAGRGLRHRDVVGVFVPDAACCALATGAIRAAGGVPSPIGPGLTVAEIAGQLADCGARMLLTGPPLTGAAQAAADRSWVRQVICFGEAAGATPFDALAGPGADEPPPADARPDELALLPYSRQPDGTLAPVAVTHHDLIEQLGKLAAGPVIRSRDIVLAGPPAGDGQAYTALLDHALTQGATVIAVPDGQMQAAAAADGGTVAIVADGSTVSAETGLRVLTVA